MNNHHVKHYGEKDLLLHYYGENGREEQALVENHLACCNECREAWQSLQKTLGSVPRVSLPFSEEDSRRFAARVVGRAERRRHFRPWIWGGALVTAALLAMTLSFRPPGLLPGIGDNSKNLAEANLVKDLDLLQKMELLEQLDFLQELDGQG